MLILTISGNLGKDAEHKRTQSGDDLCTFSVAAKVGYSDKASTVWVDVTKWGKGAEGLAKHLRKGDKVTVVGEMSLREHEGRTYVQCRADHIAFGGSQTGERKRGYDERDGGQGSPPEPRGGFADDDSRVPF